MDEQSGESEEEEVIGEGIGESEMEELVPEWGWRRDTELIASVERRRQHLQRCGQFEFWWFWICLRASQV